jgi:BirA family biotin operon repressor/biotin-[acetyl-CoA-carboxylase] ligase
MKILEFETLPSTQKYLIEKIRAGKIFEEVFVSTDFQSDGVGSRGNNWIGEKGNLLFSFSIDRKRLPKDTPLQSLSIYFSTIFVQILKEENSDIFLKWPNDFYIEKLKLGGTVTNILKDWIVIGIGVNRVSTNGFGEFNFSKSNQQILEIFQKQLEKLESWREVFQIYQSEFEKSRSFSINYGDKKLFLKDAFLNSDGSLKIDGFTIYSER